MIYTGKEIAAALGQNWDETVDYLRQMPDESFTRQVGDKWTAGQHMEHLLRSAQPLRKALGYPKFVIRLVAGKPNRPSRDFDATQLRYQEKLDSGGAATGRFIPPAVGLDRKEKLLRAFTRERDLMLHQLRKWNEPALDNYLLPHPLLGKVTVREMMFFTTFHTAHHLKIMKRDFQT